jgi:ABC-type lipoprotein release transport system permease subunit
MNPLSPLAYYRRHKGRALLLTALVALSTLGICIMVRLLDSSTEQYEATQSYLTRLSLVAPRAGALEAGVVARLETHPDVARTIPVKSLWVTGPMFATLPSEYAVFGVSEADLPALMGICGLRLKEGRLPQARSNGIVLTEEVAEALDLHTGDAVGRSVDEAAFGSIATEMRLTGILEATPEAGSGVRVLVGLASLEYLDSHEAYADLTDQLLVAPRPGHQARLEQFLETTIASTRTVVWTWQRVIESTSKALRTFHLIFGVVDLLVAVVMALVVGAIHRIAMIQRVRDLGLLHALGYGKGWLVRRLAGEMGAVAGLGWLLGLGVSWLVFWWLKEQVYTSAGGLQLANLTPVWFTLPIPLVAIVLVTSSTRRTLTRLDAVAIVDRGTLAAEATAPPRSASGVGRSSLRPLSSWTFYQRHRRRGFALVTTIALTILGVVFPVFLLSPMVDANKLLYEYLRYVTVLSPQESDAVDPGLMAQVWLQPGVARVVPFIRLGLLIDVPPLNRNNVTLFAVSEADMQALLEVFGLRVDEGRLPAPRSNEIVVTRGIATNRGLALGTRVGKPAYELDHDLPTEMVVVGILDAVTSSAQDRWLGFASYQYVSSQEFYANRPVELLLVPRQGNRAELDAWLAEAASSSQVVVRTYEKLLLMHRQDLRSLLLLVAIVEGIVVIVAAVALAILSYIFFAQRREEFGILSALGRSRRWLVLRTVVQTLTVVVVAWLLGALVCLAGLAVMQVVLFAPKGMALDLTNPTPWLSTLPLPLTVIAVGAGLVVWMLSRLDPVSIIERRI